MDAPDPAWSPSRPVRADRLASRLTGSTAAAVPGGAEVAAAGRDRPRASLGRRLLVGYLALVASVAAVVGVGVAAQPVYGTESPAGGIAVADLRTPPTTTGWSLDLAAEFRAGVPPRCLVYHSRTVSAHRVLVTATLPEPSSFGTNPTCESADIDTESRLVMVDPSTGRVVWTRDLGADADSASTSLVWESSAAAGIVVGVVGPTSARLVSLRAATGRVTSVTSVDEPDDAINFAVAGQLVLSVAPGSGGTVDTYTLRRSDALSTTLWTRAMSTALLPQLLSDRVIVPTVDGTEQVDGRSGNVVPWATDLKRYRSIQVRSGRVVALSGARSGAAGSNVVLLDAAGRSVWSRPIDDVSALTFSRRCVIVSSGVSRLTCLRRDTGATAWTVTSPGSVVGTPPGSTTDDIETIGPIGGADFTLHIVELDGGSGRERFSTTIPRGAEIVAQGITTGYAIDRSGPDGHEVVTAFDLSDGRALWSRASNQAESWGGHIVAIDDRGRATALVDGRSPRPHDMLVG